jgi:hypothetical protein
MSPAWPKKKIWSSSLLSMVPTLMPSADSISLRPCMVWGGAGREKGGRGERRGKGGRREGEGREKGGRREGEGMEKGTAHSFFSGLLGRRPRHRQNSPRRLRHLPPKRLRIHCGAGVSPPSLCQPQRGCGYKTGYVGFI